MKNEKIIIIYRLHLATENAATINYRTGLVPYKYEGKKEKEKENLFFR